MYYIRTTCALLLFLLSSCASQKLNSNLAKQEIQLQKDHIDLENLLKNQQATSLSWSAAIAQIEQHNSTYLNSLEGIKRAQKSKKRQWWRLAPRLSAFANISTALTSLSDINGDDINASIISGLNIPNPFQFYAQLYSNELQILRAQYLHEQAKRDLHAQLITLYSQQKEIEQAQQEVLKKEQILQHLDLDSWLSRKNEIDTAKESLTRRRSSLRAQYNRIFNTPGKGPWQIVGKHPKIEYAGKMEQLNFYHNNYGKLGHVQQAIQLEADSLSLLNVKLNRYPNLSLGASSPTLLSSESNTSFDIDSLRLFSNASKSITLDDPFDKSTLRETKARISRTRNQLKHNIVNESLRLEQLKSRYANILEKRKQTLEKINYLKQEEHLSSSVDTFVQQITTLASMKETLANQESQKIQIELEFWKWDETYWKYFN